MIVLANWFEKFGSSGFWDGVLLGLAIAFVAIGFVGTFLPFLPGTALIFIGSLIHYFTLGREASGLAWQGLVGIGFLFVLSLVFDWFSGAMGAKWFGSTKWGIWGAILGGIIGLFFGLPGIIIGPIVGVFAFEMIFARKHLKEASNSTLGTVVGGIVGTLIRVALAVGMVAWYVIDVWIVN
ncbi:MAG: DUF456 domain-containing protein [Verrucomicrobiota bacterium]